MIVALFNLRIDAPHVDLRGHRRLLRIFPIDFNCAAEAFEPAASGAKELMNTEPNGGPGRIELVVLLCWNGLCEPQEQQCCYTKLETARPRASEKTPRGRRGSKRNRAITPGHLNFSFFRDLFRLRRECFQE